MHEIENKATFFVKISAVFFERTRPASNIEKPAAIHTTIALAAFPGLAQVIRKSDVHHRLVESIENGPNITYMFVKETFR